MVVTESSTLPCCIKAITINNENGIKVILNSELSQRNGNVVRNDIYIGRLTPEKLKGVLN